MTHPDILILGGGSAGSVLASRLSADPARHVVLVEAGTHVTDPDVQRPELWPLLQGRDYDWAYATTPQLRLAGRRIGWARGRGWGGSSNLHAMAHMRGCRADFDRWAEAAGDDRWSWDALLPYFRRMESYSAPGSFDPALHGTDGPLPVMLPGPELSSPVVTSYTAGWRELGVRRIPGHNAGEMIGATPNSLTIRAGRRVTVSEAYLSAAVTGRPNLELHDRTTVHRLRISGERIIGVEVSRDGHDEILTAGHIILAMGAIADPLLLMRSGIGDPMTLKAAGVAPLLQRRDVGRNLHDHLLGAGNVYRSRRPVPPTRLQLSESMAYLAASGLEVSRGSADVVVGCVVGLSVSEEFTTSVSVAPSEALTLLFGVTNPTSRGRLHITGPDADDPPVIDANYLHTEHDRAMFRRALEYARLVGGTEAMAEWVAGELLPGPRVHDRPGVDEFVARSAITHHHPVGTCRMGHDDEAIVDAGLSMRGLEGLSIVDASVIPAITAGPVHAPVLAIAEAFAERF